MATAIEIIYDTYNDLVIRDVKMQWKSQVKDFMLQNYFVPNKLFKQLNYQHDPIINDEYFKYLDTILNDECSIVAVHKDTDRILAAALLKCMTKEWRSWTAMQLSVGSCKFTEIVTLQYRLMKDNIGEFPLDSSDSLHIFEYFIDDELKTDCEFVNKFFDAIYYNASLLKMPRVTILALSYQEQKECEFQGYTRLLGAVYTVFRLRNRLPFITLRDINEMTAVLYEKRTKPFVPYKHMKIRGMEDVVEPNFSKTTASAVKNTLG